MDNRQDSGSDGVELNLLTLLQECAKGCLASQHYIARDLLKLSEHRFADDATGSKAAPASILDLSEADRKQLVDALHHAVRVDVKAELAYKEGSASQDLVTTADVLTQAVLVRVIRAAFPHMPFTIVGEEDSPDAAMESAAAQCIDRYYHGRTRLPYEDALQSHVAASAGGAVVTADSLEALRRRVAVYIDPIDGTNCFVTGVWEAPMTLVGIAVDGLPVAAVCNRVFLYPVGLAGAETAPGGQSLSYVWNVAAAMGSPATPFMVHEGQLVPPERIAAAAAASRTDTTAPLILSQSSTTKESFLQSITRRLEPTSTVFARGAGNKQFLVVAKALGCTARAAGAADTPCDVFVCPGHTIKKWDTCAPHAFIRALGGELWDANGAPLRYATDVEAADEAARRELVTDLGDGVVAATAEVTSIIASRLGWGAPSSPP